MHNTGALKPNTHAAEVLENPCSHWFLRAVFTITEIPSRWCCSNSDHRTVERCCLNSQVCMETCFIFTWATWWFYFFPLEDATVTFATKPLYASFWHWVITSVQCHGKMKGCKNGSPVFLEWCSGVLRYLAERWLEMSDKKLYKSDLYALPFGWMEVLVPGVI